MLEREGEHPFEDALPRYGAGAVDGLFEFARAGIDIGSRQASPPSGIVSI
jgi:hypothetical protein